MKVRQRFTTRTLTLAALAAAGVGACGGGNNDSSERAVTVGSLAISAAASADIAGFQIDVTHSSVLVSSTFVGTSVGGATSSASTIVTLAPGLYAVKAKAMSAPGVALAGCTVGGGTIRVTAGQTSELTLNARCDTEPGAIAVTVGANFAPVLTQVAVEPSTTVAPCGRLTLTAEATDRDGDPIAFDLAVLPAAPTPVPSSAGAEPNSRHAVVNLEPPAPGDHTIRLRACDALGCGSLDIPLHVQDNGGNACSSTCDDQNPCTLDSKTAEGVCQNVTAPDSALCTSGALHVKLLGINDFHGQLDTGKLVSGRPVGGAAVLASYLEAAQSGLEDQTLIVHAGDLVGASPPSSALLEDEPSVQFLNTLANASCTVLDKLNPHCNIVGTLGNHEFDEGMTELLRLLNGGNFAQGPFLEDPYPGASFPYVSANVIVTASGQPLIRPFVVKEVHGVPVGFIGAVLKATPTIVTPTGVAGLTFLDEADAINAQVPALHALGVHAIVVTIHQGGFQSSYAGPTRPASLLTSGPEITDIVRRLDNDIDVVISGHTHAFTNAFLPNQNGKRILVTQAFSASTAYDDVDLLIDPVTKDVTSSVASIVTTFGDAGPGLTPDPRVAAIMAAANARVAPLVNQVFGTSPALTRTQNTAGESPLGDLIADSQLAAMASLGTQFAFMNPGGIRADLDAGDVTFGDLFTIQPFGNTLVKLDMTGAQIVTVLEQQWLGQTTPKILQIAGFDYTWDPSKPVGSRIVEVRLGGVPIDLAASYVVVCNNFLATGGDGFVGFKAGLNQVGGPVDLDAITEYVEAHSPLAVPAGNRIRNP